MSAVRRRPLILLTLAVGALAATVGAYLARLGYPFELLSHFRPHYAALCAGLTGGLLLKRQWRWALWTLFAAGVNVGGVYAPYLVVAPHIAADTSDEDLTRVVWANLQRSDSALAGVSSLASQVDADVVALTEAPVGWINADLRGENRPLADYPCMTNADNPSPFAVTLLTKPPCALPAPEIGGLWPHAAQRTLLENDVTIVGVHAARPVDLALIFSGPQDWAGAGAVDMRDAVLTAALRAARTDAPAVLVGDMNTTPWSPMGIALAGRGMARVRCQGPWRSTWPTAAPLIGLPIDHAYVTTDLAANCKVGADIGSDHRPLILTLAIAPGRQGDGALTPARADLRP